MQASSTISETFAGPDYSALLEGSPDGVIAFDREWRIVFANQAARRISRIRDEDLYSRSHWEIYPETAGTVVEQKYRDAMEHGIASELTYLYEPFDLWLQIRIVPIASGVALYYRDITRQRRAEEARDESLRKLQQVYDATSDGVQALDREWRITFLNKTAKRVLRIGDDLLGQVLWEAFPLANTPDGDFFVHYHRAMIEGVPSRFEAFYAEPLNMWFSIDCRPSPDGIVVFFRDITERRQVEAVLRASEERYRVIAELGPQFLATLDASGYINFANQRMLDYLGLSLSEMQQTGWLQSIHPDERDFALATYAHSVDTGHPHEFELRLRSHATGEYRWFLTRTSPVKDFQGNVLSWINVTTDVHDQRSAARALQAQHLETERQRAELETIYQTAPIGLALLDPVDFRFLRVNDQELDILGLPREEIIGRTLAEIAPIPGLLDLFRSVARGFPVRNHVLEGELPARPGERRFWNVNYYPVYAPDGTVQAVSTASVEITNQKKSELALIQSEKLAAVGRLASSISHEINNPLEAITNLLYLIGLDNDLAPATRGYLRSAQSELSRVAQIATQTLRFHRQSVRPSDVSAGALVDAVLNLYQGRLANSNIHVEASYCTSRPILCFENDIRQVLNNLIANAIDAMRSGGRLICRAHDATDFGPGHSNSRQGVRITIADTGHGMSPQTLQRIFEPFYTTKDLNGTGLGLWISKGIVQRHNGHLTIRSSQHPVHHGSVFSLFLPVDASPRPSDSPTALASATPPAQGSSGVEPDHPSPAA